MRIRKNFLPALSLGPKGGKKGGVMIGGFSSGLKMPKLRSGSLLKKLKIKSSI